MIKKKLIAVTLLTVLTVSPMMSNYSTAKAATIEEETITQTAPQTTTKAATKDGQTITQTVPSELIGLDKYITRNSNGTLTLDVNTAIKRGYQNETVEELSKYLDNLNTLIKSGELVTDNNLNITNGVTTNNKLLTVSATADCGVTRTNYF